MNIGDLATAIGGGLTAGSVLLGAHWLWLQPRVKAAVKEEVEVCRMSRDQSCKRVTETCLKSIDKKLDSQADELKYIRRRVDEHINHGGRR